MTYLKRELAFCRSLRVYMTRLVALQGGATVNNHPPRLRRKMSLLKGFLIILLVVVQILTLTDPAQANKRKDKAVYGYSTLPYWNVGLYSARLSRACQQRRFGQMRQFRYMIGFVGKKGRAITGIASSEWNLYDPARLATPKQTYHFYNDGYSDCAVYVSPQRRN